MKSYLIRYAIYGGTSMRFVEEVSPKKAVQKLCFDHDVRQMDIIRVYEQVPESVWR